MKSGTTSAHLHGYDTSAYCRSMKITASPYVVRIKLTYLSIFAFSRAPGSLATAFAAARGLWLGGFSPWRSLIISFLLPNSNLFSKLLTLSQYVFLIQLLPTINHAIWEENCEYPGDVTFVHYDLPQHLVLPWMTSSSSLVVNFEIFIKCNRRKNLDYRTPAEDLQDLRLAN